MMRICVAILLAVSVNGEVPEVGIHSSSPAAIGDDAAPLNSDPVIITANPIYTSGQRFKTAYGVSSFSNNSNRSNPKIKIKVRRFGGNTRQNNPITANENLKKYMNKDKFGGYPNASAVKTHYQPPADINVERTLDSEHDVLLIQPNNQRQTIETLNEDYEPLQKETPVFKEHQDIQIPRSSGLSTLPNVNLNVRETPMIEYGTPRTIPAINESKKLLESTYETPISLDSSISSNVASGYDKSKSNENLYRKSNYESDDTYEVPSTEIYDFLKSPNAVSKSLTYKYGVPKLSKTVRNPKPLEKSFGDMHASDVSYGVVENFNGVSKLLNNKRGPPKNNYRNSRNNREQYTKTNSKKDIIKDSQYKTAEYVDHYPENRTQSDDNPNYSTIAQAHSVKIDQEYENSNDNYEVRSNYYYDDYNDQDFSSYAYENGQVPNEASVNFNSHDSYGAPESPKPPKKYPAPFNFLASKMSPGIIGVTQAIIRPNYDYEEPAASSKQKLGSNHHSKDRNGGTIDRDSYQTHQKTSNEQARSDQNIGYTRSRARFSNYDDQFDGYPSGRNADEEESVPAVYRFEYAVSGEGTDQFGHRESRQFERTKGSYHVILPDGRKQIVDYEADEHGFKPRIRYEDAPLGYDLGPKSRYGSGPKSKSSYNEQRSGDLELRTSYGDQQTGYD